MYNYTRHILFLVFLCLGSIELTEMVEIIGTLYEMEGVSKVKLFQF
jgi:hypothetical protein